MPRIIAGIAGSLTLAVPDAGTRPTSDRVRESLFGSLDAAGQLSGARVADLYAGSGALGLEALSRGAARVDLVEGAPRAATVTSRNARRIAAAVPGSSVEVHRMTANAFLGSGDSMFDLVFLDPPYDLSQTELSQTLSLLVPRLSPTAVVVIERATRTPAPELPTGLSPDRSKKYGDTTLWWSSRD